MGNSETGLRSTELSHRLWAEGTFLSHNASVTGQEFIQRVTRLGRERGVEVMLDTERGKGSHILIYYGDHVTVVKGIRKELGPGLLSTMIRQLGLRRNDFR